MLKQFYLQLSIFILAFSVYAQGPSKKSLLSVGDQSFASKNYYDALAKYREVLEFEPNNIDYLYKAAEAARLHGAYQLAEVYYDSIWTHEKSNIYPKVGFYRAQVAQTRCDYNKAIAAYKAYLSEYPEHDPYLTSYTQKEIKACEWAQNKINDPVKGVVVDHMGSEINSDYSDFAPVAMEDKLYFSSNRFDNIYNKNLPKRTISGFLLHEKDSSTTILKNFNELFPGKSIANLSYFPTKDKIMFSVCEDVNDYDKRCELYVAEVDSFDIWQNPQRLPDHINLPGTTSTQSHIAIDRYTGIVRIFFVSDRSGGKGGLDIWHFNIGNDGSYSEPINIHSINTAQDDISPFFHSPSNTLYFSSKGYLGLGGYDIYSSNPNLKFEWSTPLNMGAPFNSCLDDVYYVRGNDNKTAYLASNRIGSSYLDEATQACCLDLYRVNIPPCDIKLKTLVFDAITMQDLNGATVKLYDLKNPDLPPIEITNDNTNLFEFPINCDKEYKIEASKPGYDTESIQFMSGSPGEFEEILKKLYLTPSTIALDVLCFDKQSGLDLNGVTVKLYDLSDPTKAPIEITNLNSNLSQFKLDRCHKYRVVAEKKDYAAVLDEFEIGCKDKGKITRKLYLDRILYSFLPLALYFDNDQPNPRTLDTTTRVQYITTYNKYYPRREEFGVKYGKLFNGSERDSVMKSMDKFFEDTVKLGKEKLFKFFEILEEELKAGKKYEIFLKGYASPLASNKYNYNLSQRRIESVKNEFYHHKSGVFLKYLKTKQLKVSEKPFGEDTAPKGISDNSKDPKSIYSIKASRERRVEIIEIKE